MAKQNISIKEMLELSQKLIAGQKAEIDPTKEKILFSNLKLKNINENRFPLS